MGFIKPDQGEVSILGMDCFEKAPQVQEKVGYLPGEIAFMEDMTGIEFIHFIASLKGMKDFTRANELIQFLELDPRGKIKRMSKGMKQKIGLVIAFMQDTPILILDEPTSGLDPLMQLKFVELMKQFKQRGKTILMSSHIFEEIENICDRVVIIKAGQIVAIEDMEKLKHNRYKHYEIQFSSLQEANLFMKKYPDARQNECYVSLMLQGHINDFIKDLSFTKTNEEDYLILGSIGFIYNGEGYKNYHLGDNDKLYFNENEVLYSSTLGNYSSDEIIDFLVNNGKRISV